MRVKKEYVLRKIAGEDLLVPIGNEIANFSGVIYLNSVASFIWEKMQSDITIEQLKEAIIQEFDVTEEQLEEDLSKFLVLLEERNMLEK